mmetsp:Transcript_61271/g.171327  ORF Transcript_61271/g.171327 Transcript_61271/m.171327 type:complete len:615 (-) Transcript_61271:166-2010(-)
MVLDTDYEVQGRLGEGSFGKVYKAQHKKTGDEVAVKQIKIGSRCWEDACKSTELQALKVLRHPFIVRLRELIRNQWDGTLYYIFEFIDSDLSRLLREHPNGLEELRSAELSRQLFAGLAYMHQRNFFHRDLKPENVLLETARDTIRIADLGQARSLRARPPFTDYVGTRWYRAPECLLRDPGYSSPVDIWASGLICGELLRGSALFCGTSTIDQLYKIFTVLGQPLADWPDFARLAQAVRFRAPDRNGVGVARVLPRTSPQAPAFLTEVLALNPRRRPLARKCLDHAFFAQLAALDIERLDTHRSKTSDRPSDEPPEGGPASDTVPTDVEAAGTTQESPEFGADLDDLDAELEKILGGTSTAVAAMDLEANTSEAAAPPPTDEAPEPSWSSSAVAPSGGFEGVHIDATCATADTDHRSPSLEGQNKAAAEDEKDDAAASQEWQGMLHSAVVVAPAEAVEDSAHEVAEDFSGQQACIRHQLLTTKPRRWAPEEAGQLRRAVKRAIRRRSRRDREALWLEVSAALGGDRGPRECKLQYARDYHAHKARSGQACRADLSDECLLVTAHCAWSAGCYVPSRDVATAAIDDGWRHYQLRGPSFPEPLYQQGTGLMTALA